MRKAMAEAEVGDDLGIAGDVLLAPTVRGGLEEGDSLLDEAGGVDGSEVDGRFGGADR